MNFDNQYYKSRKTKLRNNQKLFFEKTNLSHIKCSQLLKNNKISSSAIMKDQTETESFSLRLSESYLDETQGSSNLQFHENQLNEIVVISDSSSSESIFSCNKSNTLLYSKKIESETKSINNLETSDDESCTNITQNAISKQIKNINSTSKIYNEHNGMKLTIEERDSKIEQTKVPQFITKSQPTDTILSEKKKKEIIKWLSNNFNSIYTSSNTQESIISNSKKSDISSGNSSLERLELNFETPNNRGKLSKSQKIIQEELTNQNVFDQYIIKLRKTHLNMKKDTMPININSDKLPITNVKSNQNKLSIDELEYKDSETLIIKNSEMPINIKLNSRKIDIPILKSFNSNIYTNKNINKTPTNRIKTNSKKIGITDSKYIDNKSSLKTNSDKSSIFPKLKSLNGNKLESDNLNEISNNNIKIKSKKIDLCEPEFFDLKTPKNNNSGIIPVSNVQSNIKHLPPEREFIDSKTIENNNFYRILTSNIKENTRNKVFSELDICESDYITTGIKKYVNCNNKTSTENSSFEISESIVLECNDDAKALSKSIDLNLRNKTNDKSYLFPINNTINNSTIDDCADILENLYGKTWRDKASTLINSTNPKIYKKKLLKNVEIEKNLAFKQSRSNYKSDNYVSKKIHSFKSKIINSETTQKPKNDYRNSDSTIENSLDCSFYTAFTNPTSIQDNQLKIIPSIINKSKRKKMPLSVWNSESDLYNRNWRGNNQRELNFSSTSSNTSEFDPEDIVLPKLVLKNNKVKDLTYSISDKSKIIKQLEKEDKETFLASLSKNVSHEKANVKAMIYKIKYNIMKEELCNVLFKIFNEQVFDNQLPDDMLIEWSARLRGTAGKCYNKQSQKAFKNSVRSSRIVLSTKILDSADRLRDTLIHEMCHAATWLINNVSDGHGTFWKAWANKAVKVFPELPPISRCHTYEIQTKYTYKCVNCGYSIGRHSKSLNLNKKRCGYCHGRFELLINKITKTGNVQKKSTFQTKELSGFALYVKQNYQLVKQSKAAIKHGEVMKILGNQFSAIKITQKSDHITNNRNE
jgi:predicted SprT family Zn-dependent metalloprotease